MISKNKIFFLLSIVLVTAILFTGCANGADSVSSDSIYIEERYTHNDGEITYNNAKMNEPAQYDDLVFTVLEAEVAEGNEGTEPQEGHHFYKVKVKIQNNGSEPYIIFALTDFNLLDNFTASKEDSSISPNAYYATFSADVGDNYLNGEVAPGQTVEGYVAFEVIDDSKDYCLLVSPDLARYEQLEILLDD